MAEIQAFKKEETIVVRREIPGLVKGYLEDFYDADIVVNSAPNSMKLNEAGKVSSSILARAGNNLQAECDEKYPNGIKYGELAITSGYQLPYSLVFHCSVQDMKKENSFQDMANIIKDCLQNADGRVIMKHNRSQTTVKAIAFPLLGTGPKNLSPEICHVFYRTILSFCLGPTKSLENAYIIVIPPNQHLIDIIQDLKPFEEFEKITFEMSYPYKWLSTENDLDIINLNENSEEYGILKEEFSIRAPFNSKITSIERIQNKKLYKTYLQTRCQYNMIKKDAEKHLWFSCHADNSNDINTNGLNTNYKTSSYYGEGYQFCQDANLSDESNSLHGQIRKVYYCSVGIGRITDGNKGYNENQTPTNANTAVNNKNSPTIYIIFDKNLFYPDYLITYKTD